jgi:hypothetical protein
MKTQIIKIIKKTFERTGLGITRSTTLERLLQNSNAANDIELLQTLSNDNNNAESLLKFYSHSKSQLRQDLFVLSSLAFKKNGFFIEFGATNGIDLSNTHLMEKKFNWTGILAEPARCWHKDLSKKRNCNIETD